MAEREERETNAVARLVSVFIVSYENKTKMNYFMYLNFTENITQGS